MLLRLGLVFGRLRQAGLKMKASKCSLFQKEVAFLGHRVSEEGIACDPAKIESIASWPTPRNATEVRSFLGTANYYRRYISGFSDIAEPLTNLTKKNTSFAWSGACEVAFNTLKERLISSDVMTYPRMDQEFILNRDCSSFITRG